VPVFGLLLLGVAGVAVNAYFITYPAAAQEYYKNALDFLVTKEPPEAKEWKAADAAQNRKPDDAELKRREEVSEAFRREQQKKLDDAAASLPPATVLRSFSLAASTLTLLGGLAFLVRRGYVLAFLGCAAAVINSPDLGCCFVGVIVAAWGLMALISEEGRRYFGRVL
jgi:hypothetical protein